MALTRSWAVALGWSTVASVLLERISIDATTRQLAGAWLQMLPITLLGNVLRIVVPVTAACLIAGWFPALRATPLRSAASGLSLASLWTAVHVLVWPPLGSHYLSAADGFVAVLFGIVLTRDPPADAP